MYPLIPMDDYITWTVPDKKDPSGKGRVIFDPWVRAHLRLGAEIVAVAHRSCRVTGSLAHWQEWTGLQMPGNGSYTVPGGLFPVKVSADEDCGEYVEANVWVAHTLA
jgi:hypothetical protein